MADVLTTVLQLVGGGAYVRQLNQAAQAHQQLARAQAQQAAAQRNVQAALASGRAPSLRQQQLAAGGGLPAGGLGGIVAAAAVGAVAIAVKEATTAFVDYDRAVIRTQFTLQNMGHAVPTKEVTDFTRALSQTTGVSQTELVNVFGYLGRFRSDAPGIERAMRVIADAAAYTGLSVEEMAHTFEKARTGHAKSMFKELGIPIKGVEGQLYSLDQIVNIVDRHTHGFAERMGKELPGQLSKAEVAVQDAKKEIGRLFSPATGFLSQGWQSWNMAVAEAARRASKAMGIPEAGAQAKGAETPPGLGGPGRSKSDEYLRRIEMNTGPQGALGRALRAGGSYGEPGGGLRIRDFNLQMRHGS